MGAHPRPKKHTGRTVAIVFSVLAVLLCVGVPVSFGLRYALLANGPYNKPPNLCATMNSPAAIRLKAGAVPNPELDQVVLKEPYVGCHWFQQGVFSFMVHVKIYHKSFSKDSVDQAQDLYQFSRRNVRADVAVHDVMLGDRGYLTLDDHYGGEVYDATVRVANAEITIKYGGAHTNRTQPLSDTDRDTKLNAFELVARELVADVVEDLR
jgi:hypothetical protein